MRCHYDVLGVTETANNAELTKAYRKLALQWHPDKNLDQIQEAKKRFLEIQAAYEVLTDPRERAWYDQHRDVMLKRGDGGDYQDDVINIYPFFTASCYQGYNDSENGFYTVYDNLFKRITEQDLSSNSTDKVIDIPCFGKSDSDYEQAIGPFYAYWTNYCTLRSYVWVEEHDTRDATDRRVRRLMEQENKKARDKAKKERNDEIRELVAFVKKRDKRVQMRKLLLEERAQEKKKADNERKNKEKKKKLDELSQYQESQWMSFEEFRKQLEDVEKSVKESFKDKDTNGSASAVDQTNEANSNESENEELINELYCVACNKSFKSDKAFLNHENSKKHKESVELLKAHMQAENDVLLNTEDNNNPVNDDDDDNVENLLTKIIQASNSGKQSKSKKKKKKQRRNKKSDDESDDETEQIRQDLESELNDQISNEIHSSNKEEDEEFHIILPVAPDEKIKTKTKLTTSSRQNGNNEIDEEPTNIIHQCLICKEEFSTRNRLFDHIKEKNHAKVIENTTETSVKKNKKKKK